jgi:hypothetical protein
MIVAKILNPERHLTAAALIGQRVGTWGGPMMPGILALVGGGATVMAMTRRASVSGSILAVVWLMLAAYYVVYVITPHEVAWHVSTSADRLLVQLWPSVVVATFWNYRKTHPTR